MKLQIFLLCIIVLAFILWLLGVVPSGIGLLIMGVGVGILFWLNEKGAR